jgi:hypothetical protein
VAHQAAGIVLRDGGDVEAGVRELRQALRQARRTGSAEREADVLAGLGVALFFAGRTAAGLAAFEAALRRSSGVLAAQAFTTSIGGDESLSHRPMTRSPKDCLWWRSRALQLHRPPRCIVRRIRGDRCQACILLSEPGLVTTACRRAKGTCRCLLVIRIKLFWRG